MCCLEVVFAPVCSIYSVLSAHRAVLFAGETNISVECTWMHAHRVEDVFGISQLTGCATTCSEV